jgi:ABC-2 type transport system ATP-binding protein
MVHRPAILFLDEPTVGLDPHSRSLLWQEIKKLCAQGTTIILTTHYLDEADALCNRIAIVDRGVVVAVDTPQGLKRSTAQDIIFLKGDAHQLQSISPHSLFAGVSGINSIIIEADSWHLSVHHGEALLPHILKVCHNAGIELTAISLRQPTLDDVFLAKTGRSFSTNI